jgi:hypothetical protein
MAYWWLTDLADALRSDPWVAPRVIEAPGWKTRGRPESQFSFVPSGVLDHHTACMINHGHDPQNCLNGVIKGNSDAPGPISQTLGTWTPPGVRYDGTNVDPRIIVVAAGRANHAGTGTWPWGAPSGNGAAIGNEWCGPPGEGWPDVVIELRERVDAALLRWYHWPIEHLTIHWEYATPRGRKIDPSGAWYGQPNLGELQHWSPEMWRARVSQKLVLPDPKPDPEPTPTPPPPREDEMLHIIQAEHDDALWLANGIHKVWLSSAVAHETAVYLLNQYGRDASTWTVNPAAFAGFGIPQGPVPGDKPRDVYGAPT